ncbi:hypothetical protein DUI87_01572 [Hirundo rustica rustica]|uniref:Uncharacterized protein n=1 Tax=Hirundo rustica rustica TaxID=333673 RepID=A0A3M0LCE6_HIRRU|nr:hypothetical protein DUI87_01572 [Hirundo rustica rustica]
MNKFRTQAKWGNIWRRTAMMTKEKKLIAISWAVAYAYRTVIDTVGQQIEAGEQGDKSVTQAAANLAATQVAAKPDSEAKTPAVAAVKKGKKHTCKTDRPVDDDPGEGSSMPPDTQSGAEPTDTQSEAEATDDTQSEAKPTGTRSRALTNWHQIRSHY